MDFSPLYEIADQPGTKASGKSAKAPTVTLHVHVAPGAGKSAVVGRHGDALKVRVAAPPVGGRANEAARALLADAFGLKESAVALVSGETSRSKRFSLAKIDLEDFERRLRLLIEPSEKPRPN